MTNDLKCLKQKELHLTAGNIGENIFTYIF